MPQPPRALRDTFDLLSNLGGGISLEGLTGSVDWSGSTPQQVSSAVLGRLPQDLHYAGLARTEFDAPSYFQALLLSEEFRGGIVPNLLAAYPEKPRNFFVHVPRCGGTSLGESLAAHACTIPHNSLGAGWASGTVFLEEVAGICRAIPEHPSLHVSGHYTLRYVIDQRLARFGDNIWTSVRPPGQLLVSYMNYILTVLEADPDLTRPDSRHWSGLLGLREPLSRLGLEQRHGLLSRMIRNDQVLPRDLLCHFLGDGTAESAVDLLAAADVEVIDSARLDLWRQERWAAPSPPWRNISKSFFKWDDLGAWQQRQLRAVMHEDQALHRAIRDASQAAPAEALSVRGLEIARCYAGSRERKAASAPKARLRRAARPILLDPHFVAAPDGQSSWADPPLNYRTIETTLQLPLIETRLRLRYAKRRPRPVMPSDGLLSRWLARVGTRFAKEQS